LTYDLRDLIRAEACSEKLQDTPSLPRPWHAPV